MSRVVKRVQLQRVRSIIRLGIERQPKLRSGEPCSELLLAKIERNRMSQEKESKLSRRDLLKSATIAGASLGLTSLGFNHAADAASTHAAELTEPQPAADSVIGMKFEPRQTVRLGIIGIGARGLSMLGEWLAVENVQVTAICDIDQKQIGPAQQRIERAGQKPAAVYDKN